MTKPTIEIYDIMACNVYMDFENTGLQKEQHKFLVAFFPTGGAPLPELELPERTTFVLGAEREGLPDDVVVDCELQATITLAEGADSLNVAVSGAIALYQRRRRRR
jgi:tRNA G18 (ribose-2'-O)-methylase SpoU